MGAFINIAGKTFGRWTVIRRAEGNYRGAFWVVVCVCGNSSNVDGYALRAGESLSCGCLNREVNSARKKHGRVHTPEYASWYAAKQRCTNPNHIEYARYGGRGIQFCDRWSNDFRAFLADMGEKPSKDHSIDRIDGNKDYSPDNCRWASRETQNNNKRNNLLVDYRGERLSIFEAVKLGGSVVTPRTAGDRIRHGWDVARAIETPVREELR